MNDKRGRFIFHLSQLKMGHRNNYYDKHLTHNCSTRMTKN